MSRIARIAGLATATAFAGAVLPVAASDSVIRPDTRLHLSASYSLGAMGRTLGTGTIPVENTVLRGALFGLMPGLLKELADSRSRGNHFSGRDMAANLAGAVAGAAFGKSLFVVPTGLGDGRGNGLVVGIHGTF
jgi:uncharacterized protein YfiM (DUF2279 family)